MSTNCWPSVVLPGGFWLQADQNNWWLIMGRGTKRLIIIIILFIYIYSCHNLWVLNFFMVMHTPTHRIFSFIQCSTNWRQKSSVDWSPCLPAATVSLRGASRAHHSTREPGFSPGKSSAALGGKVLSWVDQILNGHCLEGRRCYHLDHRCLPGGHSEGQCSYWWERPPC